MAVTGPARPSAGPRRGTRTCAAGLGHCARPAGPAGRGPGDGREHGEGQDGNGREAGAQDREIHLNAGAQLSQAGRPDGHQRRRRDGDRRRDQTPSNCHQAHLGQRQRREPAPGHAQGTQDRELHCVEAQLAAEQLGHHGQRDQARQGRERGERDRLRAHRPLHRGDLIGQIDGIDLAAGGGVAFRQGAGGADEGRGAGTGSKAHPGIIGGEERPARRGSVKRRA